MNLYEAIFQRKSQRKYRFEEIPKKDLEKITTFYSEIKPLFPGFQTEIGITDNVYGDRILRGLFGLNAPYYMTIYTVREDRSEMNAGYVMEQISLYMLTLGIGSCFLGGATLKDVPKKRGNLESVIVMAFGYPDGPLTRRSGDAKRLPEKELCVYKDQPKKWMKTVIEAARLAPSAMNRQPWRFVVQGSRIHIFSRKYRTGKDSRPLDDFSFGAMFSHIAIASEELWLEVDLIRLEDISQKNFKSNQYVLSAIVEHHEPDEQESSDEISGMTNQRTDNQDI